jgi:hypothetical protein
MRPRSISALSGLPSNCGAATMSGSAERPMSIGPVGTVFVAIGEDPGLERVGGSQHS